MSANNADIITVMREARALLARAGNNFTWSSWEDAGAALREVDSILADLEAVGEPDWRQIALLFLPTGCVQEVSLSSGWGDEFLALADRFDATERAAKSG